MPSVPYFQKGSNYALYNHTITHRFITTTLNKVTNRVFANMQISNLRKSNLQPAKVRLQCTKDTNRSDSLTHFVPKLLTCQSSSLQMLSRLALKNFQKKLEDFA